MSQTISIDEQGAAAAVSLLETAGQNSVASVAGLQHVGIVGAAITQQFDGALRRWVSTCGEALRESSKQLEKAQVDVRETLADLRDVDEQIAAHLGRLNSDIAGTAG